MTLPPYIPGLALIVFAAADILLTPEQAEAMTAGGFQRYIICALAALIAYQQYRMVPILDRLETFLTANAKAKDDLLIEAAKEAMKP